MRSTDASESLLHNAGMVSGKMMSGTWKPSQTDRKTARQYEIGQERAAAVIADFEAGRKPDSLTLVQFFAHRLNSPSAKEPDDLRRGYAEAVRAYLAKQQNAPQSE